MFRLLLFIFFVLPLYCSSQIITTVGGNGTNASTGNGGLAINAAVAVSGWCIFDKEDNLYFTEVLGNRIRKISNSGIITKVAGTGNAGFNGDNISADTARLFAPKQIATDKFGNVYIADYGNHRIRKINVVTGIITTVAGTGITGFSGDGDSAKNALLNGPFGVCLDPIGNMYIADYSNSVIRKVDTNGIIVTYAGIPGSAGYSGDGGPALAAQLIDLKTLCSDSQGNIYVIAGNVRRIDAATGIITTVAGNSTTGYNGDNIAADTAALYSPLAITVDKEDNLIIADKANNRIRKVDEFGIITTIVGTGNGGFSGDGGLATNAEINWAQGIAYDSCGNLYINDMQNYRVRKVTYNDTCGQTSTSTIVSKKHELNIFPNPANTHLTITANNLQSITITNTLGQIVHSQKAAQEKTVVDISALNTGVYFVTVTDKQGVKVTTKVVKE